MYYNQSHTRLTSHIQTSSKQSDILFDGVLSQELTTASISVSIHFEFYPLIPSQRAVLSALSQGQEGSKVKRGL